MLLLRRWEAELLLEEEEKEEADCKVEGVMRRLPAKPDDEDD
jgi:hypothetical protein